MSRRVYVVSELYYPEETSTGYFLTRIAEGLAQEYPVSVLCSQPTYSARGTHAPDREQHNGADIQRCHGTTLNKDRLLPRLVNLLTISLSIFWRALTQFGSQDVVLVVTNPPALPFLIALACWLRRAKCLLLIHDVYPEVFVAAGMLSPGSPWVRLLSQFTTRLYRRVARIIVLGRDTRDLIARTLGPNPDKIVIIPNWADIDEIHPRQSGQTELAKALGLAGKFIVQYSGNMGRTHDLEILVECAQKLEDKHDIHFLLVGWGAKRRWLEDTISAHRISNMTLLGNRPRNELADSLNTCDVGIISFVPGMAGISVPSRMYNIMAAGKPILAAADADSELARVVQEEQIGWVIPPGDSDAMTAVIVEAHSSSERVEAMGARARKVAETKYTLQAVIAAYSDLIRGVA